jgi:hypothetical protein
VDAEGRWTKACTAPHDDQWGGPAVEAWEKSTGDALLVIGLVSDPHEFPEARRMLAHAQQQIELTKTYPGRR